MPQLDPSTYASQIFWLIICFFSLLFLMSKFIIPKISDIRQQRDSKIDGCIQKAEELQEKTEAAIHRYESALAETSKKATLSLQTTKDELNKLIVQKQTELDKKLKKQIELGEKEISENKEAALKEIKNLSTELAVNILEKLNITNIKKSEIKNIIEHEAE